MNLNAKHDTSVRGTRSSLVEKAGGWLFALFLFAGYYKADPRLAFIQTHIDITVLFWVLSFCVFLYRILKKPSTSKIPERFAIVAALFLLLVVCLVGSLLYSESTQYGYDKTLRFIVLTGWAFFGAGFLISDILSLKRFSWAIAAISVAMAIDALTGYVGVGRIGFVTALGSNYIALARASGLGLLATVAFLLPTERTPLMKRVLWGIAALTTLGSFECGGKGTGNSPDPLARPLLRSQRKGPPVHSDRALCTTPCRCDTWRPCHPRGSWERAVLDPHIPD